MTTLKSRRVSLPPEPPPSLAAMRELLKREGMGRKAPDQLRDVFRQVAQEPRAVAFIITAALMEALLSLIAPWVAARAIDSALPNAAPSMLTLLAIGSVAAGLFTAWTGWLHEKASVVLLERVEIQTLGELMQSYLATPFAELQKRELGATKVTFTMASLVVRTVVGGLFEVITLSATALATLCMLGSYSAALALSICLAALVTGGLAALLALREIRFAAKNLGASSRAEQLLHTLLRGVATLRVFHATERLVERWVGVCSEQAQQAVAMESTRLARAALLLAARQLVTWTTMLWLVNQTMDGLFTLGAMTSCSMLVSQLLGAFVQLTQSWLSVRVLQPATSRINNLRKASQQARPRVLVRKQRLRSRDVQVQKVWHRYRPESPWVLSDFSEDYASGSYTVLRAASGAGKSTLLRLIAGLLTPEHGRVLVCGRDPSTTEELVAYVPQQTLLLDASIAANLSALSGGRMQQARAVAERTGLTQLLARLPMGEETLISGAGSNLSAGQRQLITLTAAFATEQPVLLLDEVVSQLDSHSRELIDWGALTKDRTVISVQHF